MILTVFEILTCKYLILTPFRSRLKTYRFGDRL